MGIPYKRGTYSRLLLKFGLLSFLKECIEYCNETIYLESTQNAYALSLPNNQEENHFT